MKTLFKSLLLHPQRTLDLEYHHGGDDSKSNIIQINGHISVFLGDFPLLKDVVERVKCSLPRSRSHSLEAKSPGVNHA